MYWGYFERAWGINAIHDDSHWCGVFDLVYVLFNMQGLSGLRVLGGPFFLFTVIERSRFVPPLLEHG